MCAAMLCGDEVASCVVDIGGSLTKMGSAGQDSPHHIFRSDVGVSEKEHEMGEGMETSYVIGDSALRVPRKNMEVRNPFTPQGEVNWEYMDRIFEYGIRERMKMDLADCPIMLAENSLDKQNLKEKMAELLFETHSSPALFIAPTGMLSSFCAGRPTSLVIDFGARETRVMPVVDGFVLRNAVVKTSRGGDWLDNIVLGHISATHDPIKLWFEKQNPFEVTTSFRKIHTLDIIKDIKKWMCFVPRMHLTEELLVAMKMPAYELPDGTEVLPTVNICSAPERYFSSSQRSEPRVPTTVNPTIPAHMQYTDVSCDEDSLTDLVMAALSKCDVDCRKELTANIVICGGASIIDGLIPRVTAELSAALPSNFKVKALPMQSMERQNASWIGGSILGICGSFQQLWLSKAEYEEFGGSNMIQKKFIH